MSHDFDFKTTSEGALRLLPASLRTLTHSPQDPGAQDLIF